MAAMSRVLTVLVLVFAGIDALKISSCSDQDAGNKIHILIVDLNPDPIAIPGKLTVGGTFEFKEDIKGGKISADVKVTRKVMSFISVKAPCLFTEIPGAGIGSCHYENLCDILDYVAGNASCPTFMGDLPCHCPFSKGIYKIPAIPVEIPKLPPMLSKFATGTYSVRVVLKNDVTHEELGCYDIELKIGKKPKFHNQAAILDSPVKPGQDTVVG